MIDFGEDDSVISSQSNGPRVCRPIPVDLDGEEGHDLVHAVRNAAWVADEVIEKEGGGTRHWVRDGFLPALRTAGYTVHKIEPAIRGQGHG